MFTILPALNPVQLLDIGLLSLLVIVAIAIIKQTSLLAIVVLQGVYSLLCAVWFVLMDAVDVAFTEAAVGAGISTILMLGALLASTKKSERDFTTSFVEKSSLSTFLPLGLVFVAGCALLYAVPDMPAFGDAHSPANVYLRLDYINATARDIQIPNVVTAVLASYRSFDTFGETVVIFTAGLGIALLLGLRQNTQDDNWQAHPAGINIPTAKGISSSDEEV